MKLCGDCRWVGEPTPHTDLRLCLHPVSGVYRRVDAVTGKESAEPMTCWLNRGLGPCGGAGRDWEPADAPVGFI